MTQLTITRPDDWHLHLRDGQLLAYTVPDAARYFGRAIVMPNLLPPVLNTAQALAYRERIMAHRPTDSQWKPLMVLYLTDNTDPAEIERAKASGHVVACKYYPAGATTNSDSGVTQLDNIYPVLARMEKIGMPLLLHGEVTDTEVDIFDREAVFIDRHLGKLTNNFPALKIVLEHITTRDGAQFVAEASARVAATITPQHLLFNRNQLLAGGVRPHYYCLPILKRQHHQQALIAAATSGDPSFFLGTDSAPHSTHRKETACGCAGCYSNHAALELYAEAFNQADALDKLEGFASFFGADFYGMPRNTDTITLQFSPWQSPTSLPFGSDTLTPLGAGETRQWSVS
ncbi:MAG: dihydroorotase [Porticoccus sp.]|jgi:dihydroorotase|uniref:dihydroorotase n=1 Tax=Porticoccus hydrocarbonoclasticus TaxID=1073414 RepID=UPI000566CDDD|nr:dihydroorotase [Porticoccus hydrocarbonoclasticus]MBG58156.1 dihydroorotase [Porticoccus sp.]|tara:strand:+ start:7304 stop:8335 length:1032 start_codon:yes stop_codon:yes gene_type:complete